MGREGVQIMIDFGSLKIERRIKFDYPNIQSVLDNLPMFTVRWIPGNITAFTLPGHDLPAQYFAQRSKGYDLLVAYGVKQGHLDYVYGAK